MIRFKDLNIEYTAKSFEGEKISMDRVLNQEITIVDFKIQDSKIPGFLERGAEKCLYLQIRYKGELRVIFTGGSALIEVIQKVPQKEFPFITTIIKENKRFLFT